MVHFIHQVLRQTLNLRVPGLPGFFPLIVPGSGQVYLGKHARGFTVQGFFLASVAVGYFLWPVSRETENFWGIAVRLAIVLYLFAPLDAYFTAKEINRNTDQWIQPNPRVAALLNLTTKGFGYFYAGDRKKGIITFFVVSMVSGVVTQSKGSAGMLMGFEVLLIGLAVDAYRLAEKQVDDTLAIPLESSPILPDRPGLSAALPACVAAFFALNYFLLAGVGLYVQSQGPTAQKFDHSQDKLSGTLETGQIYENSFYGLNIHMAPGWKVVAAKDPFYLEAKHEETACSVQFIAEPNGLFRSPDIYARDLAQQILAKNKNFEFVDDRPSFLGNLAAREVRFRAKFGDAEVLQDYFLARRKLMAYSMIATMDSRMVNECHPASEQMRKNFDVR